MDEESLPQLKSRGIEHKEWHNDSQRIDGEG